jgi:hypothetical protein
MRSRRETGGHRSNLPSGLPRSEGYAPSPTGAQSAGVKAQPEGAPAFRLVLQLCKAVLDRLQIGVDDLERIAHHIEPTRPLLQFAPEPLPMLVHFFKRHAIFQVHKPVYDQLYGFRHLRTSHNVPAEIIASGQGEEIENRAFVFVTNIHPSRCSHADAT